MPYLPRSKKITATAVLWYVTGRISIYGVVGVLKDAFPYAKLRVIQQNILIMHTPCNGGSWWLNETFLCLEYFCFALSVLILNLFLCFIHHFSVSSPSPMLLAITGNLITSSLPTSSLSDSLFTLTMDGNNLPEAPGSCVAGMLAMPGNQLATSPVRCYHFVYTLWYETFLY